MSRKKSRRQFLQTTAALGVGYWALGGVAPRESLSANEEIRFASVGVGGKGTSDSDDAASKGIMVAMCDVDDSTLNKQYDRIDEKGKLAKDAKKFNDYRKMLDEVGKSIDAVTVSTPDHMHAPVAAAAIRLGKHCFVQKPLTHSIYEARMLGDLARQHKVATQMGNQGTANNPLREMAAMLQSGALGAVKEVHCWTNRPVWPQGDDVKIEEAEAPATVHWPEWIGRAKMRPYSPAYHPFKWRGFWDFGTGALGDMACHTLNMPFMGLNLKDPLSVQAISAGHKGYMYPAWSVITFEFPALGERGPVQLKWYDGGKKPATELFKGYAVSSSGVLVVGEKGTLYAPGDYAETPFADPTKEEDKDPSKIKSRILGVDRPKVEWVKSPGHFEEWVRAIKGGDAARSNFADYAGPLTEVILLGNLAVWAAPQKEEMGKKIEWDAKALVAKNAPEVAEIVKPIYHNGYTL